MKTFILPALTKGQLAKLRGAGVQFFGWKEGGILINGEEMLQKALGALAATSSESRTPLEGMVELALHYERSASPQDAPIDPALARSRANYIKACGDRMDNVTKATREALIAQRKLLPETEQRFVKATRVSLFANKDSSIFKEQFAAEIERLRQTPKVLRVRVSRSGAKIYVFTDTLYANAPNTDDRHELGKFLFVIQANGHNNGIRFFNGTRRVKASNDLMNAPYIYADGAMMANEIKQTFLDQIARCEFAALSDLAIQFIETVNDDYAGRLVNCWPAV